MANYTTVTRVQAECKIIPAFTVTSVVTEDEVESFIEAVEAELDVALSYHGQTVPVTTPASLATWLGKIATDGAAAMTLRAIPAALDSKMWEDLQRRYDVGLKLIRDGRFRTVTGNGVSSYTVDHAGTTDPIGEDNRPIFTRDMEW